MSKSNYWMYVLFPIWYIICWISLDCGSRLEVWKTITTTNYATATDYAGINFFPGFTLTWEKRGKPLRPLIMQLPPILQTLISFQVLLDLGETLSIGGFLTLNHSPWLRRRYRNSIIINYGDVMASTTRFWAVSCGRKRGMGHFVQGGTTKGAPPQSFEVFRRKLPAADRYGVEMHPGLYCNKCPLIK